MPSDEKDSSGSSNNNSSVVTKKQLKWMAFAKTNTAFGFDHLNILDMPAMSQQAHGYAFCFQQIHGWLLPQELNQFNDVSVDLTLQLSLTMYHIASNTFFGSTWMGTPYILNAANSAGPIDIEYSEIVYLLSRISDPTCVGVIEIVTSKLSRSQGIVLEQFGCGWTLLHMFQQQTPFADIAEGQENVQPMISPIYSGSPRDLLLSNDPAQLSAALRPVQSCSLQYRIFANRRLLRVQRLLGENEFLGRFAVLPGVAPRSVSEGGSMRPKQLACIGDEELFDDSGHAYCVVPAKPTLEIPLTLWCREVRVTVADRYGMESMLLDSFKLSGDKLGSDNAAWRITSRHLKIGMHNGHCLLGSAWQVIELTADSADPNTLIVPQKELQLNGYVQHDLMGLCFALEYEVAISASQDSSHLSPQLLLKAAVKGGDLVLCVCVGVALTLPCEDGSLCAWSCDEKPTPAHHSNNNCELVAKISSTLVDDKLRFIIAPKDIFMDDALLLRFRDAQRAKPVLTLALLRGEQLGDKLSNKAESKSDRSSYNDSKDQDRRATSDVSSRLNENEKARPATVVQLAQSPRRSDADDDAISVVDSLITGNHESSSLRLDPNPYGFYRGVVDNSSAVAVLKPNLPQQSSMLLARAMNVKLSGTIVAPIKQPVKILENVNQGSAAFLNQNHVSKSVRNLSRGARSRLDRHGFGGILKSETDEQCAEPMMQGVRSVDVMLEVNDILSVNEVSLQFAGYRTSNLISPVSIHCSFNFYNCRSTRTESMRLLAGDAGKTNILVRDDIMTRRDEPPLAIRFEIDSPASSPSDLLDFAEYMSSCCLCVDVWQSESLMLIGSCEIPLRKLMRQGKPMMRYSLEADIINKDMADCLDSSVARNVNGVVGALQLVMTNIGRPSSKLATPACEQGNDVEGLNWRVHRDNARGGQRASGHASVDRSLHSHLRPVCSVRAKPLSESTPELSRALQDLRASESRLADDRGMSHSMAAARSASTNALSYDEVVLLFKKFQGSSRGLVQYAGPLLALLDVCSEHVILRKFVDLWRKLTPADITKVVKEFGDGDGHILSSNFMELMRSQFERFGMSYRPSELQMLAQVVYSNKKMLRDDELVAILQGHSDRLEWTRVGKKFRAAVQAATLHSVDVEQALSKYDVRGSDSVSKEDFSIFLSMLSKHSNNLSTVDNAVITKQFATNSNTVSIQTVCGFLGLTFVGNMICKLGSLLEAKLLPALANNTISVDLNEELTFDRLEKLLGTCGVFEVFTHEQVKQALIQKTNVMPDGRISLNMMLSAFELSSSVSISAESLLRILLDKIRSQGVLVDEVFRHFDKNGDGGISFSELEDGLSKLKLFDNIPGWKEQVQTIARKFDQSKDGVVSLKEFFQFLGVSDYVPDIVQRMTKIFAVASERGLSIKEIFQELDADKNGKLDGNELLVGLKMLGTFGEITAEDMSSLVKQFDSNGDGIISLEEFVAFFQDRVSEAAEIRRRQKPERLCARFKSIMLTAQEKGATAEKIFDHFDKDRDGTISISELCAGIKSLPHFSSLSDDDITATAQLMDKSNRGEVSLEEFDIFVNGERTKVQSARTPSRADKPATEEHVQPRTLDTFRVEFNSLSKDRGISVEQMLARLDDDGDGLISLSAWWDMLERGGVLDIISEKQLESALKPCIRGKKIDVVELLRVLENKATASLPLRQSVEFDDVVENYEFSSQPEIRALEKKLRMCGRAVSSKAIDVEALFKQYDPQSLGMLRRVEFVEVMSKLGIYVLEDGQAVRGMDDGDSRRQQIHQVKKIKGELSDPARASARLARKIMLGNPHDSVSDFKDQVDCMSIVKCYRQNQKQQMLNRVLTHSLATDLSIYARFGKLLYFEYPVTNPFAHEERFSIEFVDTELKLVTNFEEWLFLRAHSRPAVGALGPPPDECELFDRDASGHTQLSLLANETIHIPFSFLTLLPWNLNQTAEEREISIKFVSCSHGYVCAVLKLHVHHRPFAITRTVRYLEEENAVMRRSVLSPVMSSQQLFVHCVECAPDNSLSGGSPASGNVVVEWMDNDDCNNDAARQSLLIRYKCGQFPSCGNFYLLLFGDSYQSQLKELWQVFVHSRQVLRVHSAVGSASRLDVIVKGDRYSRRVRAYCSPSAGDVVSFMPGEVFQLVPGAFNKVTLVHRATAVGARRLEINLIDVDSKELISAWLLVTSCSAPSVARTYNVQLAAGSAAHKKIAFKNPWDVHRQFLVSSSDEYCMTSRDKVLQVGPQATVFLRLNFQSDLTISGCKSIYLFINDESGQCEECFQFIVSIQS